MYLEPEKWLNVIWPFVDLVKIYSLKRSSIFRLTWTRKFKLFYSIYVFDSTESRWSHDDPFNEVTFTITSKVWTNFPYKT